MTDNASFDCRAVEGRIVAVQGMIPSARRLFYGRPMRLAPLLVLLLLALPARAGEFVAGTEDVPLMPGLSPVADSSVVFDKPEGRIVEAQAKGKLERDKVRGFYAATLPQLGWKAQGDDAWGREGEELRLDFAGQDGNITVNFTLSPKTEAPK
jgi:hypothetical protein